MNDSYSYEFEGIKYSKNDMASYDRLNASIEDPGSDFFWKALLYIWIGSSILFCVLFDFEATKNMLFICVSFFIGSYIASCIHKSVYEEELLIKKRILLRKSKTVAYWNGEAIGWCACFTAIEIGMAIADYKKT